MEIRIAELFSVWSFEFPCIVGVCVCVFGVCILSMLNGYAAIHIWMWCWSIVVYELNIKLHTFCINEIEILEWRSDEDNPFTLNFFNDGFNLKILR